MDYARKYDEEFVYEEYKESLDYFGLADNVFHSPNDFSVVKKKFQAELKDSTLADVEAKKKFKKHDEYLTSQLIDKLEDQKREFIKKIHTNTYLMSGKKF